MEIISEGGGYDPNNRLVTRMPLGAIHFNSMKKVFVFVATVFLFVVASLSCRAQTFHVSGNVFLLELQLPLWEAVVQVKGTNNWTQADENGNYAIVVQNWLQNKRLVAMFPHCYNNTETIAHKVNFSMKAVNIGQLVSYLITLGRIVPKLVAQEGYGPDGPALS